MHVLSRPRSWCVVCKLIIACGPSKSMVRARCSRPHIIIAYSWNKSLFIIKSSPLLSSYSGRWPSDNSGIVCLICRWSWTILNFSKILINSARNNPRSHTIGRCTFQKWPVICVIGSRSRYYELKYKILRVVPLPTSYWHLAPNEYSGNLRFYFREWNITIGF